MTDSYMCYNCLSVNTTKIGVLADFDNDVFRCNECGLVQSEFLSEKYLENYYKEKYRKAKNEKINENYIELMKKRAFSQKEFIKSKCKIPPNCKIIDIGAGIGELLLSFREECKQLYAVEYDYKMKRYLSSINDINLIDSDYLFNKGYKDFFNFVFMSHVFEHLNDPKEYLRNIHKIMREDGYLFLDIPNEPFEIIKRHISTHKEGLGHLFFYNKNTITKILKTSNLFEIICFDSFGISIQDFLNGRSVFDSFEKNENGIYIRCILKKNNEYFEDEDRSCYYKNTCTIKDLKIQCYCNIISNLKKLEKENALLLKENTAIKESYSFKIGKLLLSPLRYLKRLLFNYKNSTHSS